MLLKEVEEGQEEGLQFLLLQLLYSTDPIKGLSAMLISACYHVIYLFRSISAQPAGMNNREEDTDTDPDGRDGVLRHLKGQFQSYSRLGDRRSDGSHITNGQSDKWLKQVK